MGELAVSMYHNVLYATACIYCASIYYIILLYYMTCRSITKQSQFAFVLIIVINCCCLCTYYYLRTHCCLVYHNIIIVNIYLLYL